MEKKKKEEKILNKKQEREIEFGAIRRKISLEKKEIFFCFH